MEGEGAKKYYRVVESLLEINEYTFPKKKIGIMRMTEWNFSNVRKNGMKEYLTSAFHPPMKIVRSV